MLFVIICFILFDLFYFILFYFIYLIYFKKSNNQKKSISFS